MILSLSRMLKIKAGPLFVNCHFWKPRLECNKHFKVRAGKFRVPLITLALHLFNWKLKNKNVWLQKRITSQFNSLQARQTMKIHVFTADFTSRTDNYHEMYNVYTLDCIHCIQCCTTYIGKCCDVICNTASYQAYSIRNVYICNNSQTIKML